MECGALAFLCLYGYLRLTTIIFTKHIKFGGRKKDVRRELWYLLLSWHQLWSRCRFSLYEHKGIFQNIFVSLERTHLSFRISSWLLVLVIAGKSQQGQTRGKKKALHDKNFFDCIILAFITRAAPALGLMRTCPASSQNLETQIGEGGGGGVWLFYIQIIR